MMNAVQYLSRYVGCPAMVEGHHTCGKPVTHEESTDGLYWKAVCNDHCTHTGQHLNEGRYVEASK